MSITCVYIKSINTAGVGFMSVMVNTLLMVYCTTHFTLPSEIPEINY